MPVTRARRVVPLEPRFVAAVLVAALFAAACGSTVPAAQQAAAPDGQPTSEGAVDGQGLALDAPQGDAAQQAPAGGGDGDTADGMSTGGSATGEDTAGATTGGAPHNGATAGPPDGGEPGRKQSRATTPTHGARTGKGITPDKIFVGLVKVENAGEANDAIGAGAVSQGDPNRQTRAMVNEINRTGGLAGRKLVPVWYELDENTAQTKAQIEQQMCATWTQDSEVFAAFPRDQTTDLLKACMEKAGSVLIGESLSISDARTFAQFPHYFEIGGMRLDRIARIYPRGLAADDYFGEGAVVGVVTYDTPAFNRATDTVLVPELTKLGHKPKEVARVAYAQTTSELGGSSAGISNALLQFREAGVTHVLFLEDAAVLAFLWMRQAESQAYRPRYGLMSQSGPQALTALVPAEQLDRAVAIGWIPFIDVGDTPRTQVPPGFPSCLKIMRAAGEQYSTDNPNAKRGSGVTCDALRLLQAGMKAAGRDLTPDGFVRGVRSIGDDFQSAHTYDVDLRRRRDGASVVRPSAFSSGCTCFRYTGPARSVG